MLSIQDVIDYCDRDRGELEAIAEHEHLPITVAAEMSASLLCTPEGVCRLHVLELAHDQHLPAHEARHAGPTHHADHHAHDGQRRLERRRHRDQRAAVCREQA